ncbi:acyltransferase domain-containing protein [Actinobacteria bacterium YIM 96077]|uniref:[acyl-carrier-protein] S-malonyltransferase n=1 Tax=Phytoactinopolyspora halophila TaxID=1981511 RepID=A0A329QJS9_9ACTN|nr:acyltransferase domain-containing protein [Phytoactinopolyspora halophila]AYY12621.1 acyltransferase domain-containing protein [Actinobacteria bacterium YIM 96077]RAW12476.1 hypothetical protein DPM12_13825 [Phytoactinopolyspora halophila]
MDTLAERRRLVDVQDTEITHSTTAGRPDRAEPRPASATDDHQLLLLDAESVPKLRDETARLIDQDWGSSYGGLDNLAATLQGRLKDRAVRAGVVAASADQARERLAQLAVALNRDGQLGEAIHDVGNGVFAGRAGGKPTIGFLFPGQGADVNAATSALTRRFETARDLYRTVTIPTAEDSTGLGANGQRIVASSIAGLRVLSMLGIEASMAAGHSLGELTALHWAGAMRESTLLALVNAHGQIMAKACDGRGSMATISTRPEDVEPLLRGEPVAVAGYNTPTQTVVAGPADAVARVLQTAAATGLRTAELPVREAFHTPAMAPAMDGLRAHLEGMRFRTLERTVQSTVTGDALPPDANLHDLLVRQLCEPVRFSQAVGHMADEADLIVEVGPDQLLSRLAVHICPGVPVVPLATDSTSSSGLLCAAAAAYVLGAPVRHEHLVWPRSGSTPRENANPRAETDGANPHSPGTRRA